MSRSRLQTALLFALLALVGAAAWSLELSGRLVVDPAPLVRLPPALGSWIAEEIPLEDEVADMLRADVNVQRAYRHSRGELLWLYVGYYGTARGGRPEHTPWVCYPAAGWSIDAARKTLVDPETDLWANELVVESEGERRLVLFWYRSGTRTGLTGGLALSLSHLRDRVLRGRADGALVRVSTPIEDGDAAAARALLAGFAAGIDRQIADHWPAEHRGGSPAAAAAFR